MNFRIDYEDKPKTTKLKAKSTKIDITGKIIAITGTLPGMTRAQATYWAKKKKSVVASRVDQSVSYLIVGKSQKVGTSMKIKDATRLKIPQISILEVL